MKQNKRKHIVLIVMLLSMAFVSTSYVRDRDYEQKNKRVAIIYPKHSQSLIQEIQEGIQDCACDHQVKLDVWYKDELSQNELDDLVTKEYNNQAMGLLLVYPEKYMKKTQYEYRNVLALTDTMQDSFTYTASFSQTSHETMRLPVDFNLLKEISTGKREAIYIEDTYKLGYKSIELISHCEEKRCLSTISLKPEKVDQKVLEKGSKASLFTY